MTYSETLHKIFGQAHDLSSFIHAAMNEYDSSSPEWAELYAMTRLAGVLGDLAYHTGALGGQASARTEPVANGTGRASDAIHTSRMGGF